MRIGRGIVGILIATAMMAGCNGEYEPQQDTQKPVVVDFAFTVTKAPQKGTTRMASANLTGNVDNIQLLYIKPFIVDENQEITIDDTYETESTIDNLHCERVVSTEAFNGAIYTSPCTFTSGVNKLLAYAYDNHGTSGPIKGALVTTFSNNPDEWQPANISFSLQSIKTRENYLGINGDTDEKTIAEKLADYLTNIANASIGTGDDIKTWKDDAFDASLKLLYKNFINELVSGGAGGPLPGSAANVKEWGEQLKTNLDALTFTKGTAEQNATDVAIRTAIETEIAKWNNAWNGFPSSIGLPDGAAVVRWQKVKKENNSEVEEFVPETRTTTIADINNIERFAYPAEIYYFSSSSTMVSNDDLSGNFTMKGKWKKDPNNGSDTNYVLDGFREGAVDATTKTVAMKEPLQYGVAQLHMKMKGESKNNDGKLPDADDTRIVVGTNKFKLTGIIVGGQLPVGFDFRPETRLPTYSEADMKFIYDTQLGADPIYLTTSESSAVSTLVLQSYTYKNVKIALEFENDSENGVEFKGMNGTVFKGTKFYLVGEVPYKPVVSDPKAYDNRVFTQDYVTTISVNVTTLAKAYNVLPDLLSPRLEMGLELTPQWEKATPSDVIL